MEVGDNNIIRIVPVRDVACSLTKYARRIDEVEFDDIRKKAWGDCLIATKARFEDTKL